MKVEFNKRQHFVRFVRSWKWSFTATTPRPNLHEELRSAESSSSKNSFLLTYCYKDSMYFILLFLLLRYVLVWLLLLSCFTGFDLFYEFDVGFYWLEQLDRRYYTGLALRYSMVLRLYTSVVEEVLRSFT